MLLILHLRYEIPGQRDFVLSKGYLPSLQWLSTDRERAFISIGKGEYLVNEVKLDS